MLACVASIPIRTRLFYAFWPLENRGREQGERAKKQKKEKRKKRRMGRGWVEETLASKTPDFGKPIGVERYID